MGLAVGRRSLGLEASKKKMAGGREAEQLQDLELGEVEETGKKLGEGSYGVVLELKVKGLR